MSIGTIVNLLIATATLWLALACFIGAVRFAFRLLVIEGIGMLLISVPFVMDLLFHTWPAYVVLLATGSVVANGYRLLNPQKYQTARTQRGITLRKLLFFAGP
jgi:hypothetical protein